MNLKRAIYYKLTPELRLLLRRTYYFPYDFWQSIAGKKSSSIPPKGLMFVGSGDFVSTGNYFLNIFINECNLKPTDQILDIGCGIGRIAIPLTTFLNKNGHYDGFDIVKNGIEWCKKNITSKFPNFEFLYVPLSNDLYNLNTTSRSALFKYPYDDSKYDLVIATSVFTHMMPEDTENYIREIYRVLKQGGKCYCTFFLLNNASVTSMNENPDFCFPYKYGDYSLMNNKVKEANVAYEETYIQNLFVSYGFSVSKVSYGSWSGISRTNSTNFQDSFILVKP
jgi:ubiquinone/menaquinone biosynthesis C-methylase UbiE